MAEAKSNGWGIRVTCLFYLSGAFPKNILILDGLLLATAALTDKVSILAPVIILGLLIVCVSVLAYIKPLAFYHPNDWPKPLNVNLDFRPIEASAVHLDVDSCKLEVRNREGEVKNKNKRKPNLSFDIGGWTVSLPEDIEYNDAVRLILVERNNVRKWEVDSFNPYVNTVKPYILAKVR